MAAGLAAEFISRFVSRRCAYMPAVIDLTGGSSEPVGSGCCSASDDGGQGGRSDLRNLAAAEIGTQTGAAHYQFEVRSRRPSRGFECAKGICNWI